MEYRIGTTEDYPAIKALVDATGYYSPISPTTMGGHWAIAVNDEGVHATLWFFGGAGNAYLDYWVGSGKTVARLGCKLQLTLENFGITMVRGMILSQNKAAERLAVQGHGFYGARNYTFVCKELPNGRRSNDDD